MATTSDLVKEAVESAVLAEREACAAIADKVLECYYEHTGDCTCTGEPRALPHDIARHIRARTWSPFEEEGGASADRA